MSATFEVQNAYYTSFKGCHVINNEYANILSQSTRETTGRNVLLAFDANDNIDSMMHLNVSQTKGIQSFSMTMNSHCTIFFKLWEQFS